MAINPLVAGQLVRAVDETTLESITPGTASVAASTTHTITDPGDTPATADALRDDLVTNTIPAIEAALNTLGSKINLLQTACKNAGITA